jgi:transcriptional antiterminator RfaH
MSGRSWYVVETKRHREQVAGAFLSQRGIPTYLPRIAQWPRPAVGGEIAPLFPGYLFVCVYLEEDYQRVTRMIGVKTFVTFGGGPVPLRDDAIEVLRRREGPDGLIRYSPAHDLPSEVRVVDGPFRGLSAVVEQRLPARDRIRVLMHVLQRQAAVELPERWVRPL